MLRISDAEKRAGASARQEGGARRAGGDTQGSSGVRQTGRLGDTVARHARLDPNVRLASREDDLGLHQSLQR